MDSEDNGKKTFGHFISSNCNYSVALDSTVIARYEYHFK